MPFSHLPAPLYEIKADLFKGLAHPFRIRVLELLSQDEELTVSALLEETGLEASHLSQHLSVLRRYGLVISQRRGSHVHYRLATSEVTGLLAAARTLLHDVLEERSAISRPLEQEEAEA